MNDRLPRRLAAPTAFIVLAGSGATLARTAWHGWGQVRSPGPVAADEVVALLAAVAAAAVALWLAVGMVVSAAALLAGWRLPGFVPAGLHRGVALALGMSLVAVAMPAAAHPAPSQVASAQSTAAQSTPEPAGSPLAPDLGWTATAAPSAQPPPIDPGWTPAPPAAPARTTELPSDPLLVPAHQRRTNDVEQVAVHRGDTLWDLAARHLGADATDAEIASEWPRWHEANRDVVGPDPDLLLPGQLLLPPHRR